MFCCHECLFIPQEQLSLFLSQSIRSANESMQLRRADVARHSVSARNLWRKVGCAQETTVHTVIHPLLLPIAPPTQISSVVDENGSFDVTPLK